MILDIVDNCYSPGLYYLIKIIKNILDLVQVILPILLIISLVLTFTKLVNNPDEKKYLKNIKNSIIALLFSFFVPLFINILFNLMGDNFSLSKCWNSMESMDVSNTPTYMETSSGKRSSIIGNPDDYEKGNERVETNNSSSSSSSTISNNANTYNSIKYLATYKISDLHKIASIPSFGSVTIAQSMTMSDNYYIVGSIAHGDSKTAISVYNKSGKRMNVFYDNFRHCNGLAYNNTNDTVTAVTMYNKVIKSFKLSSSISDKPSISTSKTSSNFSGIAYDSSNSSYYFQSGSTIYIADSNMKVQKKYKKIRTATNQDIGAYGGVLLSVAYASGYSAVDMYRASDGAYLGSIKLSTSMELEDVTYDGTTMSFLFNNSGNPDYIYTKNLKLF